MPQHQHYLHRASNHDAESVSSSTRPTSSTRPIRPANPPGYSINYTDSNYGDKVPRTILLQLYSDLFGKDRINNSYFYGKQSVLEATQKRVIYPIKQRMNTRYYTTPYGSGMGFFAGVLSGPVMAASGVLPHVFPAAVEFITGLTSLCYAFYHKTKGNDPKAKQYFRDGLSRLILSPALAILGTVGVAVELVRFITRLIATVIKFAKSTFDLAKDSVNKMFAKENGARVRVNNRVDQDEPAFVLRDNPVRSCS